MAVKNEARIKTPLTVGIREQLEHRALWMYLLIDEARKKGLDPKEYVPQAIERCGHMHGEKHRKAAGGGESLKGLKKVLFGFFAQRVFEMKDVGMMRDEQWLIRHINWQVQEGENW